MSRRSQQIQEFNSKLESVKSQSQQGQQQQQESNRAQFPNFDNIAKIQKQQLEERRQDSERRNREAVERSHIPKSAEEYRGPGATQLKPRTKNEATDSSQLSVPILDSQRTYYSKAIEEGKRLGKKTSDVCHIEADARITGRGSNFAQEHSKTFKGWKPGCF